MVKRVFAIIGIVLGSVTAFAGAVFGVLALMGKFKTPKVYPTNLKFEHEEIMVIEKVPFDTSLDWSEQSATIESFKLIGTNPDEEHSVNQKDCFIEFVDNAHTELITLCDEEGEPLKAVNERYVVQCNEPVYFMVNDLKGKQTDGVVELKARSTNDTLKRPNNTLKIHIDREVKAVFVNDADQPTIPNAGANGINKQEIRKGIGIDVDFDFAFITPLSERPIATVNPKDVEIYYDASGDADGSTDYIRVTEAEISNSQSLLHSVMKFDSGKFTINSQSSGIHKFYLAVFPTYDAKAKYEALQAEHTNYERAHSGYMLLTELTVVFEDVQITEIGFIKQSVAFALYSEQDYITLNMEDAVADAKNNNNLGLYMKKGSNPSYSDFSRFDGVNVNGFGGDIWYGQNSKILFTHGNSHYCDGKTEVTGDKITLIQEQSEEEKEFTIVKSNLYLASNLVVVDHLVVGDATDVKYHCSNGVAVLNTDTNTLQLLRTGTYLNFFIEEVVNPGSSDQYYKFTYAEQDVFKREITYVPGTYGVGRTWIVVPQSVPTLGANKKLIMGVLAVNSAGKFEVNSFFKTINATVSEIEWKYALAENVQSSVTFTQSSMNFNSISFEDIVKTTQKGSYNQGVLLVGADNRAKVETVDLFVEYGDPAKKYYVVGKTEGENFLNVVQPKEGIAKTDKIDLYLLKLKNNYQQTAESIISEELKRKVVAGTSLVPLEEKSEEKAILADYILNSTEALKVSTFSASYELNANLLTIQYLDKDDAELNLNSIYEKTSGYKIRIISQNDTMLKKLKDFYGTTMIDVEYNSSHLEVTSLELQNEDKELLISFNSVDKLYLTTESISMTLNNLGGTIKFADMKIVDGSPSVIILNAEDGATGVKRFSLATNEQSANSNNYLKLVVSYDKVNSIYKYTYYLVKDGNETEIVLGAGVSVFNSQISEVGKIGFQGDKNGVFTYNVDYKSLNVDIFTIASNGNGWEVLKMGEVVLSVTIGTTEGFVKLAIENDGNFKLSTLNNQKVYETRLTDGSFASFEGVDKPLYQLTYGGDDITTNNILIKNVKSLVYGDGSLSAVPNADQTAWFLKKSVEDDDANSILKILKDGEGKWTFVKSNSYIYLQIEMTISAKICDDNEDCKEKVITLAFASNISIAMNYPWNANNVLFKDTQVQLSKTDYALFKVMDKNTPAGTFSFVPNDLGIASVDGDILTLNGVGELTITVKYGDAEIQNFTFEVKPNVVITSQNELTSLSDFTVSEIYSLSAFKIATVYGSTNENQYHKLQYYKDSLFTEKSDDETIYSRWEIDDAHLEPLASTEGLSVEVVDNDTNDLKATWEDSKIKIDHIKTLGGVETIKLSLMSGTSPIDENREFIVKNKYTATVVNSGEESKNEELIFDCMKNYGAFVKVTGDDAFNLRTVKAVRFNSVKGEYEVLPEYLFEFDNYSGEEKYALFIFKGIVENGSLTPITEDKELDIMMTYCKGACENSQCVEACYTLNYIAENVLLRPYTPIAKQTVTEAYSGTTYDLLAGFYDVSSLDADDNIKKLTVTGIFDKDGNDITSAIVENFAPNGFEKGVAGANCLISFKEIVGASKTVYVQFAVTYAGEKVSDKTYSYQKELTVCNRLLLSDAVYPEQGLSTGNIAFNFLEGYTADALEISGKTAPQVGYVLNVESYETMLVYTNASTKINFKNDAFNKTVSRFIVADKVNPSNTNHDLKIELIAYQNDSNLPYQTVGKIQKVGTNEILIEALGSTYTNVTGFLIFKVSTVSGDYGYYYVRIYCKGSNASIKTDNNLDVVAYTSTKLVTDDTAIQVGENGTYKQLVQAVDNAVDLESKFGVDYNTSTTKLYLYNGIATGGVFGYNTDAEGNSKKWKELSDEDMIIQTDFFNTITIGLLYDNGYEKYTYGTITIYVQPKSTEVTPSCTQNIGENETAVNFEFDKPNGEFTATLDPNTTSVTFTGWTSTIKSIDGVEYVAEGNNITFEDSKISIAKRDMKDTLIYVEYKKGNTVVYVTYTLKATTLPTQESTIDPVNVGDFVAETGFVNVIDLDEDATENNKYLGSYRSEISISATGWIENETATGKEFTYNGNKFTYNSETKVLTFLQTVERWSVNITIEYLGFESTTTRTFTIVVEPGIEIKASQVSGSGVVREDRYTTKATNDYENDYENENGSQLEFKYIIHNSGAYYEWTVAGLTIYTSKASNLNLTFSNKLYVLGDTEVDGVVKSTKAIQLKAEGKSDVYFPHMAKETSLDVEISIVDSDNTSKEFEKSSLYLNVAKTYGGVRVEYLTDSDHENIQSGARIEDLHTTFTSTETVKLKLLEVSGKNEIDKYSFENIGFTKIGNPNYLQFDCSANGMVKTFGTEQKKTIGMDFDVVTANTPCNLIIANNSGMASVVYKYQIMAGDYVDGLDYSTTDGILAPDKSYISFMTAEKQHFIIGKMLDLMNSGEKAVFSLSVTGLDEEAIEEYIVIEGKYNGDGADSASGVLNGIEKKFQNSGYTYYVILNFDTGNVEVYISTKEVSDNLTLTIGGVNGDVEKTAIAYQLKLHFESKTTKSNYEVNDKYVYANDKIGFKDGENKAQWLVTESNGATFTYKFKKSTYILGGQTVTENQASNKLFTFTEGNSDTAMIKFNAVGEDIKATLYLQVMSVIKHGEDDKDDKYLVAEIAINFRVQLNLQIVVNAEDLSENIGSSSMETNFVLRNKEDKDGINGFPIRINFMHIEEFDSLTNNFKGDPSRTLWASALVYDLYFRQIQGLTNAGDDDLRTGHENIKIKFKGNRTYDGVELNATEKYLTFTKDYSGDLEIVLYVETSNGTYSVDWIVHVTPIVDLKYANSNHETAKLLEGSLPFLSNSNVAIINRTSGTGVGITMQTPLEFASEYTTSTAKADDNAKVSYNYKIFEKTPETSAYSNEALYQMEDIGHSSATTTAELLTNQLRFELTLPSVRSTTSEKAVSYYVVYEIYVEYLELKNSEKTAKVFYIAYDVINYQNVETYSYEVDENASKQSANIDVSADLEGKNLILFYFTETYTVGEDEYKFAYNYNENNEMLNIELFKNGNTVGTNVKGTETFGDYKYSLSGRRLLLNDEEITGGTWSTQTRYISEDKKAHSVFDAGFSNIFEYQKFIDLYLGDLYLGKESIQLNFTKNGNPDTVSFALSYLSNGGFGIDLKKGNTYTGSNPLFNNELRAELALVHQGVKTVVVDPYTEKFKSGFILNTSTSISAKSSKSLMAMKLSDYLNYNEYGITAQTQIVGIGETPNTNWLNNDASVKHVVTPATLTIGNKSYDISMFRAGESGAKGTGTDTFYTMTAEFYYIKAKEVVFIDYHAVSVEVDCFKVLAPTGATAELNVANAVKKWISDDTTGKLKEEKISDYTVTNNNDNFTVENNILKMDVVEYKIAHPTETQYSGTIIITASGVEMEALVSFELPTTYYTPSVEVAVGEKSIDLSGIIKKFEFKLQGEIEETTLENFTLSSSDAGVTIEETKVTVNDEKFTDLTYEATVTVKVDETHSYDITVVFTKQ